MRFLPIARDANAFSLACVAAGETILIDAGFSPQQWQRAESLHDVRAHQVYHLLITHEHGDHLKGLSGWLQEMAVKSFRIWGSAELQPYLKLPGDLSDRFTPIPAGGTFSLGDFRVQAIPVVHDAVAPLAYQLHQGASTGLIATDCGRVTQLMKKALGQSDQAFLSPYYADAMLPDPNPSDASRRVASLHGHLPNQALAVWLRESGGRLERLLLGHRHPQCNNRAKIMSDLLPVLRKKVVVELHGSNDNISHSMESSETKGSF
jgi:phosphoribosyl 1,2-cyclic phosphodiesterase